MELIFEYVKPTRASKKINVHGGKLSGGKISGGDMGILKTEMIKLFKKHKIENPEQHVNDLEGSGFFDTLMSVGKKAIQMGKSGYDIYKKNEKAINKVVDIAGKAVSGYKQSGTQGAIKSVLGGKIMSPAQKAYQEKLDKIRAEQPHLSFKEVLKYYGQHYGKNKQRKIKK